MYWNYLFDVLIHFSPQKTYKLFLFFRYLKTFIICYLQTQNSLHGEKFTYK